MSAGQNVPIEISIDEGLCMGAGECLTLAPEHFGWNETKTQARVTSRQALSDDRIWAAAKSCPNFAIHIEVVG
jgi:ferredoxin